MSQNASNTGTASPSPSKSMDAIMSLCKRRGFIYQASEIYGGINGFWDYGPLGAQMKKNLREAWWQDMILNPCWGRKGPSGKRVECVPVETRIIQHPKVWEASGHVAGFNDPMVDDKETKQRFRADHLQGIFLLEPADSSQVGTMVLVSANSAPSMDRVPDATLVGSTPGEAMTILLDDKGVRRSLGIKDIITHPADASPRGGLHSPLSGWSSGTGDYQVIWAQTTDGPRLVYIRQVPTDLLKAIPDQIPSPFSGKRGNLTPPRQFNLMFKTYIGATATEDDVAYMRPETAQGIFVQFKNVLDTSRVKVPFGIGNTGTSFRNEVTPRNFTFRSREFEQAELEFFCDPEESFAWYEFWRDFRMDWWKSIGLAGENLILREHAKDELSHYSVGTSDVEYRFPFTAPGFGELEGIAHRGNFDLTQHEKHSGVKMAYFDQEKQLRLQAQGVAKEEIASKSKYIPHCIEPAAGLDRGVLALLCEAYTVDPSRPSPELMKLHPRVAPIKAAIFPLVNKDGMPEAGEKLYEQVRAKFGRSGFIEFDEKQSIGKRYARMDEAGCPFCFTIDGQTLTDQTVTVRDRDSGQQQRIGMDRVVEFLSEKIGG